MGFSRLDQQASSSNANASSSTQGYYEDDQWLNISMLLQCMFENYVENHFKDTYFIKSSHVVSRSKQAIYWHQFSKKMEGHEESMYRLFKENKAFLHSLLSHPETGNDVLITIKNSLGNDIRYSHFLLLLSEFADPVFNDFVIQEIQTHSNAVLPEIVTNLLSDPSIPTEQLINLVTKIRDQQLQLLMDDYKNIVMHHGRVTEDDQKKINCYELFFRALEKREGLSEHFFQQESIAPFWLKILLNLRSFHRDYAKIEEGFIEKDNDVCDASFSQEALAHDWEMAAQKTGIWQNDLMRFFNKCTTLEKWTIVAKIKSSEFETVGYHSDSQMLTALLDTIAVNNTGLCPKLTHTNMAILNKLPFRILEHWLSATGIEASTVFNATENLTPKLQDDFIKRLSGTALINKLPIACLSLVHSYILSYKKMGTEHGAEKDLRLPPKFLTLYFSVVAEHPNLFTDLINDLSRIKRIQIFDNGDTDSTLPPVVDNILRSLANSSARKEKTEASLFETELKARLNTPIPELTSISLAELTQGWVFEKNLGRTLLYRNENGEYLALKIRKANEPVALLWKEFRTVNYLRSSECTAAIRCEHSPSGLLSEWPAGELVTEVTGLPDGLIDMPVHTTEMGTAHVYVYKCNNDNYFKYLHDRSTPSEQFKEAREKMLHDLGLLAKNGLIMTALADLFHIREHEGTNGRNEREDQGNYLTLADLFRFEIRKGGGRIGGMWEAIRYINARSSGLADMADTMFLSDITTIEAAAQSPFKARLEMGVSGLQEAILAHYMASYLLIDRLTVGQYRLEQLDWRNQDILENLAQEMQQGFAVLMSAYHNMSRDQALFFAEHIGLNWTTLARQMCFFMRNDETGYLPHIEARQIPPIIYGEDVIVQFDENGHDVSANSINTKIQHQAEISNPTANSSNQGFLSGFFNAITNMLSSLVPPENTTAPVKETVQANHRYKHLGGYIQGKGFMMDGVNPDSGAANGQETIKAGECLSYLASLFTAVFADVDAQIKKNQRKAEQTTDPVRKEAYLAKAERYKTSSAPLFFSSRPDSAASSGVAASSEPYTQPEMSYPTNS